MAFTLGTRFTHPNNANLANDDLLKTSIRREIRAVILKIQDMGKEDTTSREIELWANNFFDALNKRNVKQNLVSERYLDFLQRILVDSYTMLPLDDTPLLGSDGHTYGTKHLTLYLYETINKTQDDEYRKRSPLNPASEIEFITEEHYLAKYMIGWLNEHGRKVISDEIEKKYALLPEDEIRILIPNKKNNRIFNILKEQKKREEQQLENNQLFQNLVDRNIQEFHHIVNDLQGDLEAYKDDVNNRMDALEEEVNQGILLELNKELDEIEKDLEKKKEQIHDLKENLRFLGEQIEEAEKDDYSIKIKLLELDQVISEGKKKRRKALIKSLAVSAACFVITCGISSALPTDSTIKILLSPKKDGLKVSIQGKL